MKNIRALLAKAAILLVISLGLPWFSTAKNLCKDAQVLVTTMHFTPDRKKGFYGKRKTDPGR